MPDEAVQPDTTGSHRDPLAAVPMVAPNVDAAIDGKGRIQLRTREDPTGRIGQWIGRLLRYNPHRVLKLDDRGTFFWIRVDGRRSLREISGELAGRYSLDTKAAHSSVVLFARSLMLRNLIRLRVDRSQVGDTQ